MLSIDSRLYEGTSEDTTDLDARADWVISYVGDIINVRRDLVSEEPGSADNVSATFNVHFDCYR